MKNLFPNPEKRGRGKPHAPWRAIVNSILFVLLLNAKWGSWPKTDDFGSKSASHRWYLQWYHSGLLTQILEQFQPAVEITLPQRRIHAIREVEPLETIETPLYIDTENKEIKGTQIVI